MASFLSALSLVILLFANSYFALPVLNELTSSIPSLNEDLTTYLAFNARSIPHDDTTVFSTLPSQESSNEHMKVGEFSQSEPSMLTTEQSTANQRHSNNTLLTTVQPLHLTTELLAKDKRQFSIHALTTKNPPRLTTERTARHQRNQDDLSSATVEPQILTTEKSVKDPREFSALLYDMVEPLLLTTDRAINSENSAVGSSFTTVKPEALTTEKSVKNPREFSALLYDIVEPLLLTTEVNSKKVGNSSGITFPTVEAVSQVDQIQKRNFENESERQLNDESISDDQSAVPSTSTRKSIGNIKDSSRQTEKQARPSKSMKPQRKLQISSTTSGDYNVESDITSNDSTIPTAIFDQDASKKIPNVFNDFMILDETVQIVVADHPEKSNTTMKNTKEAKPLNQDQKPSDIEEKESNN